MEAEGVDVARVQDVGSLWKLEKLRDQWILL